ncbi:unnamed protein product, partial [Ectocarpus sp. 12 AP-2014]
MRCSTSTVVSSVLGKKTPHVEIWTDCGLRKARDPAVHITTLCETPSYGQTGINPPGFAALLQREDGLISNPSVLMNDCQRALQTTTSKCTSNHRRTSKKYFDSCYIY